MKTNYLKTILTVLVLAFSLSYCGNCDDGVNYEDLPQNKQHHLDSMRVAR